MARYLWYLSAAVVLAGGCTSPRPHCSATLRRRRSLPITVSKNVNCALDPVLLALPTVLFEPMAPFHFWLQRCKLSERHTLSCTQRHALGRWE